LKTVNQIYKEIKVPHSFARSIRDFNSLAYWKANEFKVFMLYTGLATLINILPTTYFEHFCLYGLIMRKLCDRNLRYNDDIIIKNIEELLIVWHGGIDKLYGNFELTFTAHAHLHLPQQV
jgi:hypothetical protein